MFTRLLSSTAVFTPRRVLLDWSNNIHPRHEDLPR